MSAQDAAAAESVADRAAALLDVELAVGQQKILDTLASLFLTGWKNDDEHVTVGVPKGRWMVQQMRIAGIDIEGEYARLPWVPTRYDRLYGLLQPAPTPVWPFDPQLEWRLTLAGCLRATATEDAGVVEAARRLVVAAARTYSAPKSPLDTAPCTATHEAIMKNCPSSFEIEHRLGYAQAVLSTLPPLSGLTFNPAHPDAGIAATWNVPDAVYLFKDCTSDRDMINLMLELNAPLPETVAAPAPLAPTAVADGLDHLDAAWYRRFKKGLFKPGGLDLVTAVTTALPVSTGPELETALIDLGAVLCRWQPPKENPAPKGAVTPVRIADSVATYFPGIDREALLARLRVFEAVIHMRNGTAHSGSRSFVLQGDQTLAIPEAASPSERWDRVRRAVITAAAELRALIRET